MFFNDTAIVVALNLIILVDQLTMTTIVSLSFDLGNGLIMSILISYHGS